MEHRQARALLGVPSGVTEADIERAFRRHAHSAHPDRGGSGELFRQIQEAREVLLLDVGATPQPVRVRRSLWQRIRRRLIESLPTFLLPRHLRHRGRRLR